MKFSNVVVGDFFYQNGDRYKKIERVRFGGELVNAEIDAEFYFFNNNEDVSEEIYAKDEDDFAYVVKDLDENYELTDDMFDERWIKELVGF